MVLCRPGICMAHLILNDLLANTLIKQLTTVSLSQLMAAPDRDLQLPAQLTDGPIKQPYSYKPSINRHQPIASFSSLLPEIQDMIENLDRIVTNKQVKRVEYRG